MAISAPVAILGAGLLGAGATAYAAKQQKKAAQSAADYQLEYLEWMKEVHAEEKERREPYYQVSLAALPYLQDYISGDFDITKTHEFKVQSEALDRELAKHLAARGLQASGFGVEESARLKTALMANLYGQRFSRLAALANLGSMGMAQAPNLGGAYANLSNIALQQGQAQAALWSGLGQLPFNLLNAYSIWKATQPGALP